VTDRGERYLDMYGGHAVCATGHCHPTVVAALKKQLDEIIFYSNVVDLPVRGRATHDLVSMCPRGLDQVFFVNSGTEANENALKLARQITGRTAIVSFEGGFHGRTIASLSATGIAKYRERTAPLLPGHRHVAWESLEAVERELVKGDVAGVILEPIQSMAGVRVATAAFVRGLRELCDAHGAVLIYDEVQTGMGRTGTPFFAGRHGVIPDIMSLGKGLASGVPMGAVVTTTAISSRIKPGDLGTTFGGGPLAAAALSATVAVFREEDLLGNVQKISAYIVDALSAIPLVAEVRGEGLLVGLRLKAPAKSVMTALLGHRVITGTSEDPAVLRLMPPLTLSVDEARAFVAALAAVSTELAVQAPGGVS
jgi:acetylornithine/succinyldiaminopimelate/putrescine aminotransferase